MLLVSFCISTLWVCLRILVMMIFFLPELIFKRLLQRLNFHYQQSHGPFVFVVNRYTALSWICDFKTIWAKYLTSDGIVELFHSPFPNCHLQLNQLCVPLLSLLFLILSLTTNALLTLCLFLSFLSFAHTHIYEYQHIHSHQHIHAQTQTQTHTVKASCLSD